MIIFIIITIIIFIIFINIITSIIIIIIIFNFINFIIIFIDDLKVEWTGTWVMRWRFTYKFQSDLGSGKLKGEWLENQKESNSDMWSRFISEMF